ncbi:MAG TPA: threonine/serine exporter [Chloroflexi bacterium]|nr:threonine/serine exporter [Chloroflexota bacterium]
MSMAGFLWPYLREFGLAFIATLGFGLLFNVPRRTLFACSVTGGVGRMVRLLAVTLGASLVGGSYLGALAVALMGYALARLYRTPRVTFTVTGVIAMVPGVPAFGTMLEFAAGNIDGGLTNAVETMLIGGALAMGLTTVRVISRIPTSSPDGF